MPRLRGENVLIDIFLEGNLVDTVRPNDFDYELNLEVEEINRTGDPQAHFDTAGPGKYTGNISFELESFGLEDYEDELNNRQRAGLPLPRISITATLKIPGVGVRTYLFPDAILKPSSSVSGRTGVLSKKYSWTAGLRERLA